MGNNSQPIIRIVDLLLALLGLIVCLPIMAVIMVIGVLDTGAPIFRQQRMGHYQVPFLLYKFRTMRRDAPSVPTHLAESSAVTQFGRFLRRSKLDELPQLWNVLKGDMSLVGPRPCLLNQDELIAARMEKGVFDARPGITGLAQVTDIDMSTPVLLAETDARMLANLNIEQYFKYLFLTLKGKGGGDRVRDHHA